MKKSFGARIVVLLLTCLFLVAFAACTNAGDPQTPAPNPDDNTVSVNEYTVAVYNGVNVSVDKYRSDAIVTAVADEMEGKVFVCWNQNGQSYSFDQNLYYVVKENCVFKAIYSTNTKINIDAAEGLMNVGDTGSVVKSSDHSDRVQPVFEIGGTPEVAGVVAATKTLKVNLSALTGNCLVYGYSWQRSETAEGGYVDITDANESEYTLTSEDVGKYVRVAVTGQSGYYGTVFSSPTPKVATAAAVSSAPELVPSGAVGDKKIVKRASLVMINGYYFTLPVPKKEFYTFIGWYAGEKQITDERGASLEASSGDITLTARYAENGKVFLHTYRDVDDNVVQADVSEHYLEEGSVYVTADAIEDHECVVWEEKARYLPLSAQPADWATRYDRYYKLSVDSYFPNVDAEWDREATYAYLYIGGKSVTEKPDDWETAFNRYYVVTLTQNDTDFWHGVAHFKKSYVLLGEKPDDWETSYGNYFVLSNGEYASNLSDEWKQGEYYREKFSRIENVPSDWATAYASYYNASFVPNTSEVWQPNAIYHDFRMSKTNNPSFMTVILTGMKEKTQIECVAIYREAYRVSVSGGMGTGYYVAEEPISLRAIVTAGKAFDKWSLTREETTYYLVRYGESGEVGVAYVLPGGEIVLRYLDNGVLQTTPMFIANDREEFGAGRYVTNYYFPLTEKPADWESNYRSYYVHDGSDYVLQTSAEWNEDVVYYKWISATKRYYRAEYVLLEEEPEDWNGAFGRYYVRSGSEYELNNDPSWAENTYYRLEYVALKEEPADWATSYGSYYTTAGSYFSATDEFRLDDLVRAGVSIQGGCKLKAEFEQTEYELRYELNLNVGNNRISDDNPAVKDALNAMGFFDADDGLFVYSQYLHYNETIPWVTLPGVTHYFFNGWQLSSGGQRPVTMPRVEEGEALSVVGTFSAEKYLITILSGANGMARVGSTNGVESGYYNYGDTIRIYVTAFAGYQLSNWTYGDGNVLAVGNGSILDKFADDDTMEETIIYYYSYHITGDASDDDKTIKCNFTEREYDIIYRINYIYDDEDVTGEDRFVSQFTPFTKDGLTYDLEKTNSQHYRVYYSAGGQVEVATLNAAMKHLGVKYEYSGAITEGRVNLAEAETVVINRIEYYKLRVSGEGGDKFILCYTYYDVDKMDYVVEQAETYKEGLLGYEGYAVTARKKALYNSVTSIAAAPTAQELHLPYAADIVYWRFSDWTANYSEANQNPTAFTMPMRTVMINGTFTISEYTLSIAMGGMGANTLKYVTVNGREPSYYEGQGLSLEIPYASDVRVEYQIKTGYAYTKISYISQNGTTKYPLDQSSGENYVYQINFTFDSGEDVTYTFGSQPIAYSLTSYLRVDRENAESTEYLLSVTGLNVNVTRVLEIDSQLYYFFRIDDQMRYEDVLADHTEIPSASLLEACNYTFGGWRFGYWNEDVFVPYSSSKMPDRDLIAYTTLAIKTFGVEVPTDAVYDFDPIGSETGVYMTSAPLSYSSSSNIPLYDYYTAFNFSYILPLGYHFENWTVTNTRTGAKTTLQNGAYFRRTFEKLTSRPSDWSTKYGTYYVLREDGKYVPNNDPDSASSWDATKDYYKFSGMYMLRSFPEGRVEWDDRYQFCAFGVNTDATWKWTENSSFFYAELTYIPISEKPADWLTKYADYYIGDGSNYEKNTSPVWNGANSYYYQGLVRLMSQPGDFTQNYAKYYKAAASAYRYVVTENEYEGGYYYRRLESITDRPDDWSTAYGSYFVMEGSTYVRNRSAEWNEEKSYAKVVGYQSALDSADKTTEADRYGLFIRVKNVDPVWNDGTIYVKQSYIALDACPSDWGTAYSSYFVRNGNSYILNESSVWDSGKEYAYIGYESLTDRPDDWDTAYGEYDRLVVAPDWYQPGKKVVAVDLTLFVTANIRVEAQFAKDTFKAEIKVIDGTVGVVSIGQTGSSSGNFKMDQIKFEYYSTIDVIILSSGIADGKKISSVAVYANKNDGLPFDVNDYADQRKETFNPIIDTNTYEYQTTDFTTGHYTANIFIVVTLTDIEYKISYVLYTDLDTTDDLSEENKITLDLDESVNEGSLYTLKNKFRIGYDKVFRLNDFLSGNETLSLLTDEQISGFAGGNRNNMLVVNWFLSQPTSSVKQTDILDSYRHIDKGANLVVYGLILNLFRVQSSANEVALGFNKYVLDSFGDVYERNVDSLVVPTVYNDDVITRYGFTSDTTFEKYSFANSDKIKELTFGPDLRYVDSDAFKNCVALTTITAEEGVREIAKSAFEGCSALSSFNFPVSLVRFGDKAFSGTAFDSISIGNDLPDGATLREYGSEVFSYIKPLSSVYFDANSKSADSNQTTSFSSGGLFRGSGSTAAAGVTLYVGENALFLDSNMFGYKEAQPGNGDYLTNVVIEDNGSDLEIPDGAFRMSGLQSITLGGRVTILGKSAFRECTSLTEVNFTDGCNLTTIPDSCFFFCTSLAEIVLPAKIESIGKHSFAGTSSLTSVYYKPDGVVVRLTKIDENAFGRGESSTGLISARSGLKRFLPLSRKTEVGNVVEIPAAVTSLGKTAFAHSAIEKLILGGNDLTIGQKAFYDLADASGKATLTYLGYDVSGTVTVVYPEGEEANLFSLSETTNVSSECELVIGPQTTVIPDNFFSNMTMVSTLTVGANVQTIGQGAFSGMTGLSTVKYNAESVVGTTSSTLAFNESGKNATVVFGATVHNLPTYLFSGATGFKTLDFSQITSDDDSAYLTVGSGAFNGLSNVTSLEFGKMSSLTLGSGALLGMSALRNLSIAQDIGTFVMGVNSINKDTTFTSLSYPGFTYTGQSVPLEITAGTFTTTYHDGAHSYVLDVNSEMYVLAMGDWTAFTVARGDDFTVSGTLRLRNHLNVHGTMGIGNTGGNIIRAVEGKTYNIYGHVYTEDDLRNKNGESTVYTHLKQADSFSLTNNIDLSQKGEYELSADKTLTVQSGAELTVGKTFVCKGNLEIKGRLVLTDKKNLLAYGSVIAYGSAGLSVEGKVYFDASTATNGIYIEGGTVSVSALSSSADRSLSAGIYFTLDGQAQTINDFSFETGDVFNIADGSKFIVGHDVTADVVYVHGDLTVNKAITMKKLNLYYQAGETTYDALPDAGRDAAVYLNANLLYAFRDDLHVCGSQSPVYLYGVTARMKNVTEKLKSARKETSGGVYNGLFCGKTSEQDALLTDVAESAKVVFDSYVNYLLPLYACVYTGDSVTSVDETEPVGYILARYDSSADDGKFICRKCETDLPLTAESIYDGDNLRTSSGPEKSLLRLTSDKPVYFGISSGTVFGDINNALASSSYEVYYASGYDAQTIVSARLNVFEQLYGTFERAGRSYYLIPVKKSGESSIAGFIAATDEVTFDKNVSAPIKSVTDSTVTYYSSIPYALNKIASGRTLLLTKNYSTNNLAFDKTVTVDMNGYTLSMTGSGDLITIGQESVATVTMRGGSIIGEGTEGALFNVVGGTLRVERAIASYSGTLFKTASATTLTLTRVTVSGDKFMNTSGDTTLEYVSFSGKEGITLLGGNLMINNSDVTTTGVALATTHLTDSGASVSVGATMRYTDFTSTTGVAVRIDGLVHRAIFSGSSKYSVRIEGVNAGIVHSAGTLTLDKYVTVTASEGRSSDISVLNGAIVLNELAEGNTGATLEVAGDGVYIINVGVDHDAILHYNRRSGIEPVLSFAKNPTVIGSFAELTTYNGDNNNNDGIYTKAKYVLPIYTRQEISEEYAYLTYTDSLKSVLKPSYTKNASAEWDNAKVYAFGTMSLTTQKPDIWETTFGDYYVMVGGQYVQNTSPEWVYGEKYYYYYFTEVPEKPSNWDTNYNNYYVLDSKAVYAYVENTFAEWSGEKEYYDAEYNAVTSKPDDWATTYSSYYVGEWRKTYIFAAADITVDEKIIVPPDCVLKTTGELILSAETVVCGEIIATNVVTAIHPSGNESDPIKVRVKETGRITLSERNKKIGKNSVYIIEGELNVEGCTVTIESNSSDPTAYVLTLRPTGTITVQGGSQAASLTFTNGRVLIEGTIRNEGNVFFYAAATVMMAAGSNIINENQMSFNGKITIGGALTSSAGKLTFNDNVVVAATGSIVCAVSGSSVEIFSDFDVRGTVDAGEAALTVGSSAKVLFYQESSFTSGGVIDCFGQIVFATENVIITGTLNFYLGATFALKTDLLEEIESRNGVVYEVNNASYAVLEEEPSDWGTAYNHYYTAPGQPISGSCPTWQPDTYYYSQWAYLRVDDEIGLDENYSQIGTLAVTTLHGYSLLWQINRVETTCLVKGYVESAYHKTIKYTNADTDGTLHMQFDFVDPKIIRWEIDQSLASHTYVATSDPGDTELSSLTHQYSCAVCGDAKPAASIEEHDLGDLRITSSERSIMASGTDKLYWMVCRRCNDCGKEVLFVYQCVYNTTVGDLNDYVAGFGYHCSLTGVQNTTQIRDVLSQIEFTTDFDSTKYYLLPITNGEQTIYLLLWYDYNYGYEPVENSNLHVKQWIENEGYFSYEQHTYSSVDIPSILYNTYYVKSGDNYQDAGYLYQSGTTYYTATAVTTDGPCYVLSGEEYVLATEGSTGPYYLYSNGNYVSAPTNYYRDAGNGLYTKVEYWTSAGETYYTFGSSTTNPSKYNVLSGQCTVCAQSGLIVFCYDEYSKISDLTNFLSGTGYVGYTSSFIVNDDSYIRTAYGSGKSGALKKEINGVTYYLLRVKISGSSNQRYVLGLEQTGHKVYYDWLDADAEEHGGTCNDCTDSSGNVSGTHSFSTAAKYVRYNHSQPGKIAFDNVIARQCSVCGNYYVCYVDVTDSETINELSAKLSAYGYTVAGYVGTDRVSDYLSQLVEYSGKDDCYLVPVCPTGESEATGYALILMSHTWTITYSNVTYHSKVCTVCSSYSMKEAHTEGPITQNGNVLGYVCADCGEFIPYHFELDHDKTIAQFNTMLSVYGLTSQEASTNKKFYQYMDSNSFSERTLTLAYNGNDNVALKHILVPVNGYGDSTYYVAVYFVPHERIIYSPTGNTSFYNGIFTEQHHAYCNGCGKTYDEDHVFDGTYRLVENQELGTMILCQVCTLCKQAVAVTYQMNDQTTNGTLGSLLQPYGFDYYKKAAYVNDDYTVAFSQFNGRGGDYNPSIDVNGDGIGDYYLVEVTTATNRTVVAGYVLIKFKHHMEYDISSENYEDKMICSDCGYTYSTGHRIALDRLSVVQEVNGETKRYNYDSVDETEIRTKTANGLATYGGNDNALVFVFGPETTINDVTQYFVGLTLWKPQFWHTSQEGSPDRWYFEYQAQGYICGNSFINDSQLIASVDDRYFFGGECYFRLPMYRAQVSFGFNSNEQYTGDVDDGAITTLPVFYLLAKYSPTAPKDGYFYYHSETLGDQPLEFTSYRDLVMDDIMHNVHSEGYELATETVEQYGKAYAAITGENTKGIAVFYYNGNTTVDALTTYLIGKTGWDISGTNGKVDGTVAGSWGYQEKQTYSFPVTASGYLATNAAFGSGATIESLKETFETLTSGSDTYYVIPIYSHSGSTLYFDNRGLLYASACTIRSASTDPVMYILALKDAAAPDYGYFKNAESDAKVDVACYQMNNVAEIEAGLINGSQLGEESENQGQRTLKEFFLYAKINGDRSILDYNVGYRTTLADVVSDLPDFTFYNEDGVMKETDTIMSLIHTYLKEKYYSRKDLLWFAGANYYLPLAYKDAPDKWVTNLRLNIAVSSSSSSQEVNDVFLREENAIIANYEAIFLTIKCTNCEHMQHETVKVTGETTFKSLESYITIVREQIKSGIDGIAPGGEFVAADWATLYYGNGCDENSLISDPNMDEKDRYYHLLDSMTYKDHTRKDVSLIKIGTYKFDEVIDDETPPETKTLTIYLVLDILNK